MLIFALNIMALNYSPLANVKAKQYNLVIRNAVKFALKTTKNCSVSKKIPQNRLNNAQVVAEIYIQNKLSLYSPLGWNQQNDCVNKSNCFQKNDKKRKLWWLKTVSSTFNGSFWLLFITRCYNHGIKILTNYWWTSCYNFRDTIGYHSKIMTCWNTLYW